MNPVSFFPSPILNAVAWAALLSVPPAIVLLYFLKLKRQPLEVPSTLLWRRAIEDLHVNSLWQRLRRNLLLLLQLLLMALVILACLRPSWRGAKLSGDRFILVVDTSASMQANDLPTTRLEEAKQQALDIVGQMKDGDVAMILSASNVGRVEQPYTENRRLLERKLRAVQPTNRTSDFNEVLRYAAGLANPARSSEEDSPGDVQVAEAMPATLYILSDGGFQSIPDFSLGHLTPEYVRIGTDSPRNVCVAAFSTERNPEKRGQTEAYARLENFGPENESVEVWLHMGGQVIDAKQVDIPPDGERGVVFDLPDVETGELQLEVRCTDDLSLDNIGYAALNRARRARVLVVTPENRYLQLALSTDEAVKLADVSLADPAVLTQEKHKEQVQAGAYDLIIYDRCSPSEMPQANTLFLGDVPPSEDTGDGQKGLSWSRGEKQGPLLVADVERVHPLMQLVEMRNVIIKEGFPVSGPAGAAVLIESHIGPLLSIAPRRGFEDAVFGMEIIGPDEKGRIEPKTDWPNRRSFPVFFMNLLTYLGGAGEGLSAPSVRPGEPVMLHTATDVDRIRVKAPGGKETVLLRGGQKGFVLGATEQPGVYEVYEGSGKEPSQRFAVNLFDRRESDLRPRSKIELGYEPVRAGAAIEPVRRDAWRWVLLAGLAVLFFEWYVYNRRVYL